MYYTLILFLSALSLSSGIRCAQNEAAPQDVHTTTTQEQVVTQDQPAMEVAETRVVSPEDDIEAAPEKQAEPEKPRAQEIGWFAKTWKKITSYLPSLSGESFIARWGRKILSFFGWTPDVPLIKELEKTKKEREEAFAQKHRDAKIPAGIATIAGVFNRMEDDVKQLRAAKEATHDPSFKKAYKEAIDKIDEDVDTYMLEVRKTLHSAQDKAFRAKKIGLFSFIQQLLASEFMLEMLD